jgi:hypothetical protein
MKRALSVEHDAQFHTVILIPGFPHGSWPIIRLMSVKNSAELD